MREAVIERKTAETDIKLKLNLDGNGQSMINTGCGFFDHMLTLFASHSGYDLEVDCKGDSWVDYHHSIEDIGICLGKAFSQAIGDKMGIYRYGSFILPMDESLIMTAIDISGRSHLEFGLEIPTEKVGDFDCELVLEFFLAFVRQANVTLHIKQLAGSNSHHIIEGAFKSFARSMKAATAIDPTAKGKIPSTKGSL